MANPPQAGNDSKNSDEKIKSDQPAPDSKQIPAWHVVTLSVFSCGIYNFYWFYKALKELHNAAANSAETGPLMRLENAGTKDTFLALAKWPVGMFTLMFAVPILNLIALMRVIDQICLLIPEETPLKRNSKLTAFLMALGFGSCVLLLKLPFLAEHIKLLIFFSVSSLFLAIPQNWLNKHWKLYENDRLLVRQAFNPVELVLIIAGASLLGLNWFGAEFVPQANH